MSDPWKLIVDRQSGEIVSEGTVLAPGIEETHDVIDVGTKPADGRRWNPANRTFEERPAPVLVDRLDDVQDRFQANADFMAVYGPLSAARKAQLRTGIRAVLSDLLRHLRYRRQGERIELG